MVMTTALLLTAPQSAEAQTPTDPLQSWYFGMGAGIQFSTLYYPDLDNERFPNKKGTTSPIWSLFVQKDFGREGHIAVRPQVSFLKRGGKLTNVGRYSGYADPNLKDVTYSIDARFVDLRLPLLYQFFDVSNDKYLAHTGSELVITAFDKPRHCGRLAGTYRHNNHRVPTVCSFLPVFENTVDSFFLIRP